MRITKLFIVSVLILCGGTFLSPYDVSASAIHSSFGSFIRKAQFIRRVWHDGYWWLQIFTENGDYAYEYIDPVQD